MRRLILALLICWPMALWAQTREVRPEEVRSCGWRSKRPRITPIAAR